MTGRPRTTVDQDAPGGRRAPRFLSTCALLVVLGLVAAGCGDDLDAGPATAPGPSLTDEPASDAPGGGAPSVGREPSAVADRLGYHEIVEAAEHQVTWSLLVAAGIDEHLGASGSPHSAAAELLSVLDHRLRQHVVLTLAATHAQRSRSPDALLAAEHEIESNTAGLVNLLASRYDAEQAEPFARLWSDLSGLLVRYAQAGSETETQEAVEQLHARATELSEVIEDLTGGEAQAAVLEEDLRAHVDTATRAIDAQASEDPPSWYAHVRQAVDAMKQPAERVAAAIAEQQRLDGDVTADAARLRAELTAGMAQNAWYLGYATRAVIEGDAHVDAARGLVSSNTVQLRDTFASVLSEQFAGRFERTWTAINDALIGRAVAVARDGPAAREHLADELRSHVEELASAFAQATDDALKVDAVRRETSGHVRAVTEVILAQHGA